MEAYSLLEINLPNTPLFANTEIYAFCDPRFLAMYSVYVSLSVKKFAGHIIRFVNNCFTKFYNSGIKRNTESKLKWVYIVI